MKTIHLNSKNNLSAKGSTAGPMEGASRATGMGPAVGGRQSAPATPPNPEVPEKKPRRKFTAKYKLRILAEADLCSEPGQMGALLRREGLYSSNLTTWRRQREQGLLHALSPKKRGRKKIKRNPLAKKVAQLERDKQRLQQKLKQAELIIEAQKKMSEILGITQNLDESTENK